MAYPRIESYPDQAGTLGSIELRALGEVWKEKRAGLETTGAFQEFLEKLQREWAIETGLIERLYTWDRGVTEVLIEQGIDASLIAHRASVRVGSHGATATIAEARSPTWGLAPCSTPTKPQIAVAAPLH